MSKESTGNPEAAGLKGRRPARSNNTPRPGSTALSEPMANPPTGDPAPNGTVYESMVMRHPRVLFDPATMPLVLESSGFISEATRNQHYVVSPFDAGESIVPQNCKTAISRTLWRKGNHVRRDAFEAYVEKYGDPTAEEPASA